ncbi:neuronal acetylcholine receptor subunit alpha-10-like [Lineus longissimus]|uniref:neuronal acetylcholine receptor subunit alpha-10-like n=1 Tax=Lineus longissimus TaxID=88925 RepID=UPI002B4C7237
MDIKWIYTLGLLTFLLMGTFASDEETRLVKKLLDGYDTAVRPSKIFSDTVNVSVGIAINQFRDLDERRQHLEMGVWFRFIWVDTSMVWNSSEYGGIPNIRIPSDRVWTPDIVLYNSVDENMKPNEIFSKTNVIISNEGHMMWLTPALVKTTCKVDIAYFPFDKQRCPLILGSWTYDGFKVNLWPKEKDPADSTPFIPNGEWVLDSLTFKRNVIIYSCCPEPYPDLTFYITIKRLPLFYVYNLVMPCIFIMGVAILVFYLPPESGEKVSLGVTVLLAMTVFLLLIAESMPPTSEVVPVIGKFFGAAIFLLSLSTTLTVVVLNLHFNGEHGARVPASFRKVVLTWLAKPVCLGSRCQQVMKEAKDVYEKNTHQSEQNNRMNGTVIANMGNQLTPVELTNYENYTIPPRTNIPNDERRADDVVNNLKKVLQEVSELKTAIFRKLQKEHVSHACRHEWQMVALVLDRILLLLFFLAALITSVVIFADIPS